MSDRRSAVAAMLEARSVAVVGASVKPGSLGRQMMIELARGGFDGAVYPVNPGYDEVEGHPCFSSIAEVPGPVDLAILGVANARIEAALKDAADAGARSAVTFSSLYEEDADPALPPLPERLAAIATDAGMQMCGGNGMGFLNLETRIRATGFPTPDAMRTGPVTFLSHSGSAFAALAFNDRGIGFNLLISSGQEIVTNAADYVEYALGLESTKVLAMFLETVRDPERFRAALEKAAAQDVPVIALKVGRAEGTTEMVAAHSGALAGEDGAFEALFDECGVLRVRDLDEMADTMELFSCPRRVRTGSGIASMHDSGGERVLFADVASDVGVPFAKISEGTRQKLQDTLDPGLVAENPLDAWGTGIDADRIFVESLGALADDPETAVTVFVVDLTRQDEPYDEGYLQVAIDAFAATDKPFCVLSNLPSAVDQHEASIVRDAGIPVLEGTESGLRAISHLFAHRVARARPPLRPPAAPSEEVRERWRNRLSSGEELDELEGLELLADYGVPVVPTRRAANEDEAIATAKELGYPVALKTAAPGVTHKSDVDGVRLGLGGANEVGAAYRDVAGRLGPQVSVARMVTGGVELALGVVRDPQFGPLVLLGAGGVLVELLGDRRLAFPPLDAFRASVLIDDLRIRPLLDGARGAPPADLDSVVTAIVGLSVLAADLGEHLEALDANPVLAGPDGCVAVDALVIPRSKTAGP